MKTAAITFAILAATILNANATTALKSDYVMHKKSAKMQHTGISQVQHHTPKAKKSTNIVRDDVMWNRF
jgi:hypothetical protein